MPMTPILLAGGSGTRLWPSSRKSFPKQFMQLIGVETLFQQSAKRLSKHNSIKFNPPITITNADFRFIVREQLQLAGINPRKILIEPEAKNTAPAILAATIFALKDNEDAIVIATPTDHVIADIKIFNQVIEAGFKAVKKGKIVTFGINPAYPETGYGYLQLENFSNKGYRKVLKFIEKPDVNLAKKMLNQDNYLWNSGIFMFRAQDMIEAFDLYAKDMLLSVIKSLELSFEDMDFKRLDPKSWSALENISIDYAIMEKAKNLVAIPFSSSWSDLGNWESVWQQSKQDHLGVVLSENAHAIKCKNSLLRSESNNQQIIGLGLEDIVAVSTPDAVLVANKNKSQDVKNVVEYLKSKNIPQAEQTKKYYRPWGWFESLTEGKGFQVKTIFVNPGASLSLQSHKYRSEHWVVVKGIAKITIDKKIKLLSEGESTYVPLGSKHRLENSGKELLTIIEVQIGTYLGEDDIIRYDDIYARN